MPHTPPAGNAVNFVFSGSHTGPLANALDFAFGADGHLAAVETGSDSAVITASVDVVIVSGALDATESGPDAAAITGTVDDAIQPPAPDIPPVVGGGPFRPAHHPARIQVRDVHVAGRVLAVTAGLERGHASGSISVSVVANKVAVTQVAGAGLSPGRAVGVQNLADDELFILFEAA